MSTKTLTMDEARKIVLEAIARLSQSQNSLLRLTGFIAHLQGEARHDPMRERVLLACWFELFRTGVLSQGWDFNNFGSDFAHVTEHGKKTLAQVSRDPANPVGYLALLDRLLPKGTIARSYIEEGLNTYNTGCDKATAVMVGAASEALALDLRDTLVDRMRTVGKPVASQLTDWRIKTVLDAVEAELAKYAKPGPNRMPKDLGERFSGFWPSFTTQLRIARNDAGHPSSVDPVTRDLVHGNLLIFPEVARLAVDLAAWVRSSYS